MRSLFSTWFCSAQGIWLEGGKGEWRYGMRIVFPKPEQPVNGGKEKKIAVVLNGQTAFGKHNRVALMKLELGLRTILLNGLPLVSIYISAGGLSVSGSPASG